jgi:hypothetical protein
MAWKLAFANPSPFANAVGDSFKAPGARFARHSALDVRL